MKRPNLTRRQILGAGAATTGALALPLSLKAAATIPARNHPAKPVGMDTFDGATDDDKLTAALTYAATQTHRPPIQLPYRPLRFTRQQIPYSGMRLYGTSGRGPKNLEIAGGQYVPATISVGGGAPWWNGNGQTLYDVYLDDLAIQYDLGSSFWDQQAATLYASEFHALTHYGAAGVFGSNTRKALLTQVHFTGTWQVQGFTETPFNVGGSDNDLWHYGFVNVESQRPGGGWPMLRLDYLTNSTVERIYLSCPQGWRGIEVNGGIGTAKGYGLILNGLVSEGHSQANPAHGNLLRINGGGVSISNLTLARPMTNPDPDEHGAVEVLAGDVSLDSPFYDRAGYPGPMVYQSGGTLRITNAKSVTGEPMLVHSVGGTLRTDDSVTVQ